MSFHRLLNFWIPLVMLGAIALFLLVMAVLFVVILITCCWEKQRVRDFIPAKPEDVPPPSPYFQAMNDAAQALGFQPCGLFGQNRKSSNYRCCLSFWLSTDQTTLLCIGGGKVARIDYKRTTMISRITADKSLVSMDAFGSEDLSGTRDVQVLMNADLPELNHFHLERLGAVYAKVVPFSADNVLGQFEAWNLLRADRLVHLGLARFLSPEHNDWRLTMKGAWLYALTAYFAGLKKAQAQSDRANKRRPGDLIGTES